MKIISNVEFEKLVDGQPAKLRAIASGRAENDPTGFLTLADIAEYISALKYTGDTQSVRWLKNLAVLHKNGKLRRIRSGAETFEDHLEYVRRLHAAGSIPFDVGDSVQCKESGRYGSVVDYNPDTKEYVVVLNPFEMKNYKQSEINKTAQLEEDTWAEDQVVLWVMNDEGLYNQAKEILVSEGEVTPTLTQWLQATFSDPMLMEMANFDDSDVASIDWHSAALEILKP